MWLSRRVIFNKTLATNFYKRNERIIACHASELYTPDNVDETLDIISQLRPNDCIALKMSGLSQGISRLNKDLDIIATRAKFCNVQVILDKELSKDTQRFFNGYNQLRKTVNPYITFQMYLKDELTLLKRFVYKTPDAKIKLVRGAYIKEETEVCSSKSETDIQYSNAIDFLNAHNIDTMYCTYNKIDLQKINKLKISQKIGLLHLINVNKKQVIDKKHIVYRYVLAGDSVFDVIPYIKRQYKFILKSWLGI